MNMTGKRPFFQFLRMECILFREMELLQCFNESYTRYYQVFALCSFCFRWFLPDNVPEFVSFSNAS